MCGNKVKLANLLFICLTSVFFEQDFIVGMMGTSLNPVTGEVPEEGVYVEQNNTTVAVPDVNDKVWKSSGSNAEYTISVIRPNF